MPDHAGVRGQGRRLLLHRLRRHHPGRSDRYDQPDLELRTLRSIPRLGRNPARLVHRLRRRRPASHPLGLGVRDLRLHAVAEHLRARGVLGLFLVVVAIYPFFEAWITGDKREHHMADRPRNAPTRTAIGAAGVTFYAGMWAAASSDLIATHFRLSIEGVTHGIQLAAVLGPFVAYFITKRICIGCRRRIARSRCTATSRAHRPPPRRRVRRGARAASRLRALEARQLRRLQAADDPPECAGTIPSPSVCGPCCRAGSSRTASLRSRRPRSSSAQQHHELEHSPRRRRRVQSAQSARRSGRSRSRSTTVATPRRPSSDERVA